MIENLKMFLGGIDLPEAVIRLAIKKCNKNLEDACLMLTDDISVTDLVEEVRRQEELVSQ